MGIDLETASSADISKTGSYKYAQDPDFRILLFGYRLDDGPVEVIDLTQGDGRLPDRIVTLLQRPDVTKHAYNAQFEWYCLQRAGYDTPLEQWECTMVHGMYLGYPAGLARIGAALGLKDDEMKLSTGKALIRYFCVPNRPTRSFPGGFHSPEDDPDRWELFKRYNERDVLSETRIWQVLRQFPVPPAEWELWRADVRMNALGVRVDRDLVAGALALSDAGTERMLAEAKVITGLDNPNSQAQLLPWLQTHGCPVSDIRKETVGDQLARTDLEPDVRRVLELRQLLGKTSIKKYEAMRVTMGEGDRIRGVSQYYGANRSGRYSGRLVQLQNLSKNHISTLDEARRLVKTGDYDLAEAIYGNVPDLLSQLVRTAFIPSEGHHFVVADFSAIEARVLAWLAGEQWVMDVFASGRDIYCETASAMFGVPVGKHGPNAELRQRGKVATLALGYQGGPAAMIAMGALRMGIPEDDLPDIVTKWRASRPKTVRMWYELERAAVECVSTGMMTAPDCDGPAGRIIFRLEIDPIYGKRYLTMQLPVGRKLYYVDPELKENRFGKLAVHYRGTEQATGRWGTESTYAGKLAENCISGDALVITSSGLVRLRDVKESMLLWDGLEWVSHKGVIDKGIRETISVDGVRMTPDHKILTTEGWKRADEAGLYGRSVDEFRRLHQVYDIQDAGPRHRFCIMTDAGPMIVHNCTQAIARDCLCEVIRRIIDRGWDVVFHVHDEVIVDAPMDVHADDLCALMAEPIDWAPGLLLKGAGFEAAYYMKD